MCENHVNPEEQARREAAKHKVVPMDLESSPGDEGQDDDE
jgi:hypothetical protein